MVVVAVAVGVMVVVAVGVGVGVVVAVVVVVGVAVARGVVGWIVIKPIRIRRDWFELDGVTAGPIRGLPGAKLTGLVTTQEEEIWHAHRSHLPLIESTEALALIAPRATDQLGFIWEARNAHTARLGFTLRNTQHTALDFIGDRNGTLLADDMRLGKGNVVGTRLLGPDGWFKIEDAYVGRQVLGADGCSNQITGVFHRGCLPVFRVEFSDGTSTRVDGEHLWAVWHHNDWHRGKPPRVMETQKIEKLRDAATNLQWRIPLVQPLQFAQRALPIDPYLLGVLLGDGSLSQQSITFCCGDEEVPKEVAKVLPDGIRLHRGVTVPGRATAWGLSRIGPTNPLKAELEQLGLRSVTSATKFVPEQFLFASVEQRLALLQGLLDTDGEYCDGILGFSSASEHLRDAVRFLVESFGGTARVATRAEPKYAYKGETRIGQPSYRVTIALPSGIPPFRARKGYVPRKKFQPTRHIRSIEADGEAEVICISVDAPDQLYVIEHCIVTHNTLTAIMSHDASLGPLFIVAPLSTRAVWLAWIKRVFPGTSIGIMTGKTFQPEQLKQPIVFGHYEIIHKWQALIDIGTLVFDEAHMLTNRNARRTLAAQLLRARAKRVLCMTGTPIWNMPPNLWAVLSLVAPGAWGSWYDFSDRYGLPEPTAHGKKYTGASNVPELNARLTDVMLRRLWKDCASDLPPITRSVLIAEVSDAQCKRLDIITAKLKSERSNTAGNLATYRKHVSTVKVPIVVEEVQKVLAANEPVVAWTWHREMADTLQRRFLDLGVPVFMISGDIPVARRDALIDAWKAHPAAVLVATMSVAQVGIDLSHARVAIFGEIDYTPAIIAQTEMRTFIATRPMDIRFVIANHLTDQRIVRALIAKLGAADPLGVGAAVDTIDALRDAVMGPRDDGDLDRLMEDLLASAA